MGLREDVAVQNIIITNLRTKIDSLEIDRDSGKIRLDNLHKYTIELEERLNHYQKRNELTFKTKISYRIKTAFQAFRYPHVTHIFKDHND